jgi:hypothetical protein
VKRTPGKTPEAREKYWTKIIEAARKYSEGVTAYCRVHGYFKKQLLFIFQKAQTDPS